MPFDHKAYMKAYHKKWYDDNKNAIKAAHRTYTGTHTKEIAAYKRDWYQRNKSRLTIKQRDQYKIDILTGDRLNQNLKKYKMTLNDFTGLEVKQEGKGAICGGVQIGRRLSVDHCHLSGRVRGLLCNSCNRGLGLFKDNDVLLKKAAVYLKEYHDK